ncbi:MAG: hypothetical protein AABX97_02695, partial [Candidatus Thermoplasmatota archaeon]
AVLTEDDGGVAFGVVADELLVLLRDDAGVLAARAAIAAAGGESEVVAWCAGVDRKESGS